MTVPHYVNEYTSEIRAIKPGWYVMESKARSRPGRFQTRGNASPESLRLGAIFEHRRGWRRPLSVLNVEATTSGRALA